jgi:hypothetical protein
MSADDMYSEAARLARKPNYQVELEEPTNAKNEHMWFIEYKAKGTVLLEGSRVRWAHSPVKKSGGDLYMLTRAASPGWTKCQDARQIRLAIRDAIEEHVGQRQMRKTMSEINPQRWGCESRGLHRYSWAAGHKATLESKALAGRVIVE